MIRSVVSVMKAPITKQPTTFAINVPKGKAAPKRSAAHSDTRYRATAPQLPPTATATIFSIDYPLIVPVR